MYTHTHTRCIRHKRVGQAKQVSQCRPPLSNERELWKRASERRWRRKLKTVLCTRHHRPFGEESMRPFVTRQNFPSPHPPSIPLPSCPSIFLENTQGHQDRATCTMWKRARWTARGLRTNEFPFWFRKSNLHRGSSKWKQPARQQSAEPDTDPTEPTTVDRCLPEEETEERSRVMWRDSRGHGVNFNQNSLLSRGWFETTCGCMWIGFAVMTDILRARRKR